MSLSLSHLLEFLPWQDWAALALFITGWVGYALFGIACIAFLMRFSSACLNWVSTRA